MRFRQRIGGKALDQRRADAVDEIGKVLGEVEPCTLVPAHQVELARLGHCKPDFRCPDRSRSKSCEFGTVPGQARDKFGTVAQVKTLQVKTLQVKTLQVKTLQPSIEAA